MRRDPYIISFVPIMYGILTLNGIHVHKIQPDDGMGWLIFGIFLLFLAVILDYLIHKGIMKVDEDLEPTTTKDILCRLLFMLGVTYLAIYLFKLYVSDVLFAIVLLIFVFCGKSIVEK